jgi:hypothetical protein
MDAIFSELLLLTRLSSPDHIEVVEHSRNGVSLDGGRDFVATQHDVLEHDRVQTSGVELVLSVHNTLNICWHLPK